MPDYKQFYVSDAVLFVLCFTFSALNGAAYMESGRVFNGIAAIIALVAAVVDAIFAVIFYRENKKTNERRKDG